MNRKKLHRICIVFFVIIEVYSVTLIPGDLVPGFVLALLFYLLNMQIRYLILKDNSALLSLLIELIIVCYLSISFGGLIYLAVYIILGYGIEYFEKYLYGISALSLSALIYLLKDKSIEYIILNVFVFAAIWILLMTLKKTSRKVTDLEYLYDDVRRYSYELEKAKKQVEMYSKKVEEFTQIEERNRISEEIHDTIGHRLTALLIQMEAGLRILDLDESKGRSLLGESRDNLRESIDVLRNTVKGMKPKEYRSFIDSMQNMTDEFKKSTGINAIFKILGNPLKLSPGVELVLYKNLQESLTNSARHGKPHNIDIILKYNENSVALTVKDDGTGCSEVKRGMGITGMEERIRFVGGSLAFFSDKGFTFEFIIPINN